MKVLLLLITSLLAACSPSNTDPEHVEIVSNDGVLHVTQESTNCRMTQITWMTFTTNITPGWIGNEVVWQTRVIFNDSYLVPGERQYLGIQFGPSIPVATGTINEYKLAITFGSYMYAPPNLVLRRTGEVVRAIIELCNGNHCIRSLELPLTAQVENIGECIFAPVEESPDPGNY
jgi:hypothetical protein